MVVTAATAIVIAVAGDNRGRHHRAGVGSGVVMATAITIEWGWV